MEAEKLFKKLHYEISHMGDFAYNVTGERNA